MHKAISFPFNKYFTNTNSIDSRIKLSSSLGREGYENAIHLFVPY